MGVFSVSDSIALALSSFFGDGCPVYTDPVFQGADPPCFFIKTLDVSNQPSVGNISLLKQKFLLRYLPKNPSDASRECLDVAEKLYKLLAFIKDGGDIIHGTSMHHEFSDGALNFYADYNCFIKTVPKADLDNDSTQLMSELKQIFSGKERPL